MPRSYRRATGGETFQNAALRSAGSMLPGLAVSAGRYLLGGKTQVPYRPVASRRSRKRAAPSYTTGNDPLRARSYVRGAGAGADRVSGNFGRFADFGGPVPVGKYLDKLVVMEFPTAASDTFLPAVTDECCKIASTVYAGTPIESGRAGNVAIVTGLAVRGRIIMPVSIQSDWIVQDTYRLVVVLDKQCNGSLATAGDVFDDAYIHGYPKQSNGYRFEILAIKDFPVVQTPYWNSATNERNVGFCTYPIDFRLDGLDIPIEFNNQEGVNASGQTSDRRSNNILILVGGLNFQSEYNNAVGTGPIFNAHIRTTFSD